MKQSEAEKLLGGHATGTLTEEERTTLFAAALGQQAIFDALMDEEALRELLADPAAKAQLLAALAPAAAPKIVPFWRRTGVLGAAAGLIVAVTAGLAVLRSPDRVPPPLVQEREAPAKAKAAEAPLLAQAPTPLARKAPAAPAQNLAPPPPAIDAAAAPAPAPARPMVAASAAPPAVVSESRAREQAEYRRAEAQDKMAKKAEAPPSSVVLMEAAPAQRADQQKKKSEAQSASIAGVPGGVRGGVIGGVVGGVASQAPGTAQDGRLRDAARPPAAPAQAKSDHRVEWKAAAAYAPTWTLEPQPDGSTRVLVKGPLGASAVLLRRRGERVDVLPLTQVEPVGPMDQWRTQTRLIPGDALDLYLLNAPVDDPAKLPETGPVDGYRVRIHPTTK